MSEINGNNVSQHTSKLAVAEQSQGSVVDALRQTTPHTVIAFEDAVLVDRCRGGDMQAFGALVAKYQHRVFNIVFRLCRRQADAEELAQETFLKALEKINQFRGQSGFYTWLFRIAVNLVMTHRRKEGRVKLHSIDCDDGTQATALAAAARNTEAAPDAAAMKADTSRKVLEAIEQLDDEFRAVVLLREIEDMNYDQIAHVLNVPSGTVKSRLYRARVILREKLTELI